MSAGVYMQTQLNTDRHTYTHKHTHTQTHTHTYTHSHTHFFQTVNRQDHLETPWFHVHICNDQLITETVSMKVCA